MPEDENNTEQDQADAWNEALEEQTTGENTDAAQIGTDQLEQAQLENLHAEPTPVEGNVNMDAILDIPVSLSVEIGQTRISIRNLLQLNQGSVIELERLAGEPLDVMVNGTLIAHGEVVVVNEKFGIRVTDVISPSERITRLK